MMKRIVSVLMCLVILCFGAEGYAASEYAQLVAKGDSLNIADFRFANYTRSYASKGGAYVIPLTNNDNTKELFINIDNSFANRKFGVNYGITVEYYDEGNAEFALHYMKYDIGSDSYSQVLTNTAKMTNTGAYKTITYNIQDPAFNDSFNAIGGCDFSIKLENGQNAWIKSVRIDKTGYTVPVLMSVTSSEYGHIYTTSRQKFDVELMSESDKYENTVIRYNVTDESNNVIFNSEKNVGINANETKNISIYTNLTKYGFFTLNATIVNGAGGEYSVRVPFSNINASLPGQGNDIFGVCTHLERRGPMYECAELISKAGFAGARDEIVWDAVEAVKGEYSIKSWNQDNIPALEAAQLDAMLILDYGNPLYTGGDRMTPPSTDEEIAAYASYCGWMARNFKGKVKYYEVWNEYNIKTFNTTMSNADNYVKMLIAAYNAIKAEDPDAVVVAGGLANVTNATSTGYEAAAFIKSIFDKGAGNYCDAVSYHPYYAEAFNESRFVNRAAQIKNAMGNDQKPIILTETGWTSGEDCWGVNDMQQAVYGVKLFVTSVANDLCDRMYWYDFQNDNNIPNDGEGNFGIIKTYYGIDIPGEAKPAFIAFAGMNKMLANAEYRRSIKRTGVNIFEFDKEDGTKVYVYWGTNRMTYSLNVGEKEVDILDLYTNEIQKKSSTSGVYNITMSDTPQYLVTAKANETFDVSLEAGASSYTADKPQSFNISITNNTSSVAEGNISITVYDEEENAVYESNLSASIPAGNTSVKPVSINITQQGEYRMEAVFTANSYAEAAELYFIVNEAAQREAQCDISSEGYSIVISGKTVKADDEVTVYITSGEGYYLNQFQSDKNGEFSIELPCMFGGKYTVAVNNGEYQSMLFGEDYEIKLLSGGVEITDLTGLIGAQTVQVEITAWESIEGLNIFAAGYDVNGKLLWVDEPNTGNEKVGIFNIPIVSDKMSAFKKISCFVWDDGLKPIFNKSFE